MEVALHGIRGERVRPSRGWWWWAPTATRRSHGALGAFSFGIGATEMASVWALGRVLNVEVPGTIKVEVRGDFQPYVLPKDLILALIGKISAQGAKF